MTVTCCCDINSRKEGNILFNDALNTFLIRLYGIRHMVKENSYIYVKNFNNHEDF